MSVPGIVESTLNGEQVAAQVPLGGDDRLFVTPSRTLIYRADGLLSDESVEAFPHDAERVELSSGRRKTTITLDYGLDGSRSFTVGSKRVEDALHPVLAGVLRAAGVTEPDETVKQTYRFSELTMVVTSQRVVKHVGSAVWDEDFEEYPYANVTGLDFEEGSVASQIVIEVDGRPQRTKAPNEQSRHVYEQVQEALLTFYDMGSYAEFELVQEEAKDDADEEANEDPTEAVTFGGGVEPLSANPPEMDTETGEFADSTEPAPTESTAAETRPDPADALVSDLLEPTTPTADSPEEADSNVEPEPESESGPEPASDSAPQPSAESTSAESGGFEGSAFEPAASNIEGSETAAELARLADAVEQQNELLAGQQATIEQLIQELNRGR